MFQPIGQLPRPPLLKLRTYYQRAVRWSSGDSARLPTDARGMAVRLRTTPRSQTIVVL